MFAGWDPQPGNIGGSQVVNCPGVQARCSELFAEWAITVQHDANQRSFLARISTRVVQLHEDYHGLGLEWAKAYFQDDLVVMLMRGGFTKVEETLLQAGRGASVIQQRRDIQERQRSAPRPARRDIHPRAADAAST